MLDFIYMSSADLFGTERERKIQNKMYVSSGIRTHTTPVHDRKVNALDRFSSQSCVTENLTMQHIYRCHRERIFFLNIKAIQV